MPFQEIITYSTICLECQVLIGHSCALLGTYLWKEYAALPKAIFHDWLMLVCSALKVGHRWKATSALELPHWISLSRWYNWTVVQPLPLPSLALLASLLVQEHSPINLHANLRVSESVSLEAWAVTFCIKVVIGSRFWNDILEMDHWQAVWQCRLQYRLWAEYGKPMEWCDCTTVKIIPVVNFCGILVEWNALMSAISQAFEMFGEAVILRTWHWIAVVWSLCFR